MLAKFAAVVALMGLLAVASAAATTTPRKKRAARKTPQEPAVEQPAPAPRQLLPLELPPTPPQVTYRGGQLSILAENSTLSDVLQAVGKVTGARVEGPMSGERVSAKLGPGAPRDVVADLLAGSNFNYIIVGSPVNPAAITAVTLTVRGGAPVTSSPLVAAPQAPSRPNAVAAEAEPEEEEVPEPQVEPAAEQPAPEPGVAPPQPGGPTAQPDANPQQPKTPQQLLQELQERLRKQQEEQQENQQNQPEEPQQ